MEARFHCVGLDADASVNHQVQSTPFKLCTNQVERQPMPVSLRLHWARVDIGKEDNSVINVHRLISFTVYAGMPTLIYR